MHPTADRAYSDLMLLAMYINRWPSNYLISDSPSRYQWPALVVKAPEELSTRHLTAGALRGLRPQPSPGSGAAPPPPIRPNAGIAHSWPVSCVTVCGTRYGPGAVADSARMASPDGGRSSSCQEWSGRVWVPAARTLPRRASRGASCRRRGGDKGDARIGAGRRRRAGAAARRSLAGGAPRRHPGAEAGAGTGARCTGRQEADRRACRAASGVGAGGRGPTAGQTSTTGGRWSSTHTTRHPDAERRAGAKTAAAGRVRDADPQRLPVPGRPGDGRLPAHLQGDVCHEGPSR